jgi:hypothetical protein
LDVKVFGIASETVLHNVCASMHDSPTLVLTLALVVQFGIPNRNELSSLSGFGRMVRDPNISTASPAEPRDHRRAFLGLNRERNSSLDRVQLSFDLEINSRDK